MDNSPENRGAEVFAVLTRVLKIMPADLCLCGSGEVLGICCGGISETQVFVSDEIYYKLVAYRTSQGGRVKKIPKGLYRLLEERSYQRFDCLYPGCNQETVSCHLTPENVLRSCFGKSCRAQQICDNSGSTRYQSVSVVKAGALPVFCASHDNSIFTQVDRLSSDLMKSPEKKFRLAFKALSFLHRRNQIDLFTNLQIEIAKPFFHQSSAPNTPGTVELDCGFLHECYLRFKTTHRNFSDAARALMEKNWNFFSYQSKINN